MSPGDTTNRSGKPRTGALTSVDGLFSTLAHARDRQRAALHRQRRVVAVAKVVLPILAVVLLVALVVFPDLRSGVGFGRFTYHELPHDKGMPLSRMSTAQYRGVDAQGQKFTITADHVVQVSNDKLKLSGPKGDLTTRAGAWFMLDARHGLFHQKSQQLDLRGKVTLYRADGTTLRTSRALIDIKAGTAGSSEPVSAWGPFGTLSSAHGFTAVNRGTDIFFKGPSHLMLDQAQLPDSGTGAGDKS